MEQIITPGKMLFFLQKTVAMSFIRLRRIEDYWSTGMFVEKPDFRRIVSSYETQLDILK